ncbi:murein biosynthesis integral membrane protein MurJ [Novosphingobium sp. TH158]|uniref:murein biosynthesis integral membrane protein MurJ n=1 Tax=Novosphingobium sp. TH158 TaxID=2067455 RepID=UPI000C7B8F8F|nr:murein biosynthesis integral membrane protein MurJ [Novosphingobium sp. TH158]PLK24345.1 murein biosynthesis integral membrane protein MurJ [Novosphingobium sp. TH158]
MSLIRNVGTIGGLTAISRVFGFARDMLLARVLGAGLVADAFQLAFTLPNTFRRLFAEGAFSVAFVPMYSRALHGADGKPGSEEAAEKFADDVLAVFVWVLFAFSALAMVFMPGIVWLLAREYANVAGKFELSVFLSRVTFPYLFFISLVAMLSGLLNARSRFGPGAFAPVLLNIFLISGILLGNHLRGTSIDDTVVGYCLAGAVSLSGLAQFLYLWWETRRAGVRLKVTMPRLTPEVRKMGALILPATFGAGIYQISQLVDTFFATSLPQGSLSLLKLADRLNQMPLGIVGIALGTAILPMLSRHIHTGDAKEAQRLQSNAFEIATLLTLPAAVALAVCAPAFCTAFFVGGKFTANDGAIMANIVVALVAGLPAYVIVKILNPGFFAREDTRTPVWTALASLIFNVAVNIYVVERYGIVGLAAATAASASLNCLLLYAILHKRGWFHFTAKLGGRIARQLVATAAMGAALWWAMPMLASRYGGPVIDRVWSLSALVGLGLVVFFGVAWMVGALDEDLIKLLKRRRSKRTKSDNEIIEVQ